ncbi:MAG: hypothetical protein WCH61_08035 [bacterium]
MQTRRNLSLPARLARLAVMLAVLLPGSGTVAAAAAPERASDRVAGPAAELSLILGRPTGRTITLSVLSATVIEIVVEYGIAPGAYMAKTGVRTCQAGIPCEVELGSLQPDTRYRYRLLARTSGRSEFRPQPGGVFHTQRAPGGTFTFAIQGDSHPEREGRMYDFELYAQTLRDVVKDAPDFYLAMGDDFSIERLIGRQALSQAAVDQVYARQRPFLGMVGRSAALFLVNGNHEQAARYLLDGTADSAAVLAGRARTRFYPLPAPDGFYTGDADEIKFVGRLRDYYAWTWGDALLVVIDPYWHYARQERDGVVYQSCPNPADPTYQAFNREAYRSGDILPNSGHLRVTVSPEKVRVDYVRSYLPQDATAAHPDGEVARSYEITAAAGGKHHE